MTFEQPLKAWKFRFARPDRALPLETEHRGVNLLQRIGPKRKIHAQTV